MKQVISIILLAITAYACTSKEVKPQARNLVGQWRLDKIYATQGGPYTWHKANGELLIFNTDATLYDQAKSQLNCTDGQYRLNADSTQLIVKRACALGNYEDTLTIVTFSPDVLQFRDQSWELVIFSYTKTSDQATK